MAGAQDAPPSLDGPRLSQILGVAARGPLQQAFVVDSVRREIPPTYWKEGALIGGVVTGLGLALPIDGFGRSSDVADDCGGALAGGFLSGGVMGGVIGALIGGQFPKAEDP